MRTPPVGLALLLVTLPATAQEVNLSGFSIPPGTSVTIEFDVTIDNPLDVCATSVSNQALISAIGVTQFGSDDPGAAGPADPTVTPLAAVDLAITKTDGSATEVPGTPVTYTIVVANGGPVSAVGATVTDTFPGTITGVSWTCVGAGGGTCTAGPVAGNISDTVTVPVGGSVTYTATGTIASSATGSLANTASVAAAAGQIECNLANNSATDTNTLTPQADLAITKTDGVTSIDAGSPTSYTIVVSNSGPSDAVGATVADTFPAALLTPSTTCIASPGSSCSAVPLAGNFNDVVTILSGGSLTYTVNATVSGTASGTLSNTATVSVPGGTTDPNAGNNSATDTTTVNPVADLSITKDDGVTTAVPGMSVTYVIVASNAGPATATNADVDDTFPAACASVSWTCVGAGGGSCTAGPVAGNINDSVSLPAGGSATYTAVCTLSDTATGSLVNTATISGGGVSDTTPGNNSATDTDTILTLDFGDAPDTFATELASNGARHGVTSLRMGALIDSETDGQPGPGADGDDTTGSDDEDGVTLPSQFIACETATVTITSSAGGFVDAWIDLDSNGSFDVADQVLTAAAVVAGANPLPIAVPCTATPATTSYARFRLSTLGSLAVDGVAADGEVEDYTVTIRGLDFGDAADPAYPTLFASNGPRHVVTGSGPILGALIDVDADATTNATATGDDITGLADEDGVSFPAPLIPGVAATVTVTVNNPGTLNAWVDFNGDGSFATTGDQIATDRPLVPGPNVVNFTVPGTATSNIDTISRFRVATAPGLSFVGLAANGEVEDHLVTIAPVADLSITKTDGVTTAIPGNQVTYTIVAGNGGPDPVSGVSVTDTFPGILTCSTTSVAAGGATGNTAGPFAGNISESLSLPAAATVTYTSVCDIDPAATGSLANTASISVPAGAFDPVLGNNSATDTDTLTPQSDVAITKTDSAASSIPGQAIVYTIVASNSGPSVATGVTVTDTFPASLTGCSWTSIAAGGATGNTPGPVNGTIAEAGMALPVGSTITYTATCTIDPAARGSLANTATIASATTDPTPGNNSATDTNTLAPQVDLVVSKLESADPVTAGGTDLTYTVTVLNDGPSTATSVTLSEALTLPAGVTVGSITPSQGSFTDPTWTVGTLAPAASATLTVVLDIASSAVAGTDVICDTATVTGAAETLINTGDDSASECTSITRLVDIVVTKVESVDPVAAGSGVGNLTYTVTVANSGPSDAGGITVTEALVLPAGVTIESITPSAGSFTDPTWTIGTLAANAQATLTVVLTADASTATGTDVICNTATLATVDESQSSTANDSDSECTSVVRSADLAITKVDAEDPPSGSTVFYTVTVENLGPSDATGVVVTDTFPFAFLSNPLTVGCAEGDKGIPTCTLPDIPAGGSAQFTIEATIIPPPPGVITNVVSVEATEPDPNLANNEDSEDTTFDTTPPEVTSLTSLAPTRDGVLDDCDTVLGAVSSLRATFSEAMATEGAGSITLTSQWRLVQPGAGALFATEDCSGFTGTDTVIALDSVSWNPATFEATLAVASSPLADGQYRLLVCETATDPSGNPLAGDGATAGTPATRTFRVDRFNTLENGHFDTTAGCSLAPWTSTAPGNVEVDAIDRDGAATSGSAANSLSTASFDLGQCVPVVGGRAHDLEASIRTVVSGGLVGFERACEYFASGDCSGVALDEDAIPLALGSTGGAFLDLTQVATPPAGTASALCTFIVSAPVGGISYEASIDRLFFGDRNSIFSDGFESGDTSAWSEEFPPPVEP